jgi:hypothetical protein
MRKILEEKTLNMIKKITSQTTAWEKTFAEHIF